MYVNNPHNSKQCGDGNAEREREKNKERYHIYTVHMAGQMTRSDVQPARNNTQS